MELESFFTECSLYHDIENNSQWNQHLVNYGKTLVSLHVSPETDINEEGDPYRALTLFEQCSPVNYN